MTADPLNLAALRVVAEAADGDGIYPDTWWGQSASKWMIAGEPWAFLPDADLAHIAAFDPTTVLALLDLAERATAAEAAVERVRALLPDWDTRAYFEPGKAWGEASHDLRTMLTSPSDLRAATTAYGILAERFGQAMDRKVDRELLAPATEVRDDEGGA